MSHYCGMADICRWCTVKSLGYLCFGREAGWMGKSFGRLRNYFKHLWRSNLFCHFLVIRSPHISFLSLKCVFFLEIYINFFNSVRVMGRNQLFMVLGCQSKGPCREFGQKCFWQFDRVMNLVNFNWKWEGDLIVVWALTGNVPEVLKRPHFF